MDALCVVTEQVLAADTKILQSAEHNYRALTRYAFFIFIFFISLHTRYAIFMSALFILYRS